MNLYDYTIFPIECVYKAVYLFLYNYVHDYGIALLCLSLFTYCITHPLQNWASRLQQDEKDLQNVLSVQIDRIKLQFKGVERHNAIKRLYRRYGYHPIMAVRSAIGVGLQIPFLMAAFYMLSDLPDLDGVQWLFLDNLKEPDHLFFEINILPFVMTFVNLLGAVTTKGFSLKDIKQAGIVAVVFLVLLYDAPSALLVYWTTNNFLSLGFNILQRLVGDKLCGMEKYISSKCSAFIGAEDKKYVVIVSSLIWTVGFFVPLDVFFRNTEEFWFGINDIFHWLVLINITISFVAVVVIKLIRKKNVLNVVGYVSFFLLLDVCVQGYLLNVSYGVLDGRSINWESYGSYGLYNALLWAGIVVLPLLLLFKFKLQQMVSCCAKVSVMLLIIQGCSMLYYVTSTDCIRARHESPIVTTKGLLEFSKDENIIVIILDTFDSSYLQELINSDYGDIIRSTLKDFTYYPDTVGMYPTTKGALPYILTGEVYKNDVPYNEYIENAYNNNPLYNKLKENEYITEGYSFSPFFSVNNKIFRNIEYDYYSIREKGQFFLDFYKLSMFRIMPHDLKEHFLLATAVFDKYKDYDGEILYSWGIKAFYDQLKSDEIKLQQENKKFKVYHLQGVHQPYRFDENLQSSTEVKYSLWDVSKGCIKLVDEFLKKLRQQDIYDASTIIILADHGNKDMSQNPLFLLKNKHEDHSFVTSARVVSYKSLRNVLAGIVDGKNINPNFFNETEREYFYYIWDNSWDSKYLPLLKQMICKGEASNMENYHFTGIKYGYNNNKYIFGDQIDFSVMGNSLSYLIMGFSSQESWGTWTCAKKAMLDIMVGDVTQDLQLDIEYQTFNGSQRVNCFIDDTQIAHFIANGSEEKSIRIPQQVVKNGRILMTLELPDAKSPVSLGISDDVRELGLGIKKMRILEIK